MATDVDAKLAFILTQPAQLKGCFLQKLSVPTYHMIFGADLSQRFIVTILGCLFNLPFYE